jgi:hypothetical protein
MQGKKSILVGFPGGPVCVQQHIPGFIAQVRASRAAGQPVPSAPQLAYQSAPANAR